MGVRRGAGHVPPQPQQGGLIAPHDDPGVGAADDSAGHRTRLCGGVLARACNAAPTQTNKAQASRRGIYADVSRSTFDTEKSWPQNKLELVDAMVRLEKKLFQCLDIFS